MPDPIKGDNCKITVHRRQRGGVGVSLDFLRGSVYVDVLLCTDAAEELIRQLQAALVTREVPF